MSIDSPPVPSSSWQRLSWAFLFACAMGLLEAICVIYLRRLMVPTSDSGTQVLPPLGPLPLEQISYSWPLFAAGLVSALLGLGLATVTPKRANSDRERNENEGQAT